MIEYLWCFDTMARHFYADFHIHSRYSRATSKELSIENLYLAAERKGLKVIGTGDFTHPEWQREIYEKLEPLENGLLRIKRGLLDPFEERRIQGPREEIFFILSTEISCITKRRDI